MPTYQYECAKCGHDVQLFQSMSESPATVCPHCGRESLARVITGGIGVIFKGDGFYVNDHKRTHAPKATEQESKSSAQEGGTSSTEKGEGGTGKGDTHKQSDTRHDSSLRSSHADGSSVATRSDSASVKKSSVSKD